MKNYTMDIQRMQAVADAINRKRAASLAQIDAETLETDIVIQPSMLEMRASLRALIAEIKELRQ